MTERSAVTTDVNLPSRYRVRSVLGVGGTATVYLADDVQEGREVAVKVLNPSLAGAVAVDRFLREIRLIGHLRHPCIVPLLDAGEADGVPFYVMPCVSGESLRRRLDREHQLPIEETARVMSALASALDAAHRDGVVHRDVKPENVLLCEDKVFLADFGIARALLQAAGERLTDTGLAIGTPGYMSPEQASGDREVDIRSDIYSLGCVTFEMIAGEPPYTGPSAQAIVAKQLSLPVPSLTVVRDTISDAVDDVVRKALAKVPADRFQNAEAFAGAFRTAVRSPPTRLQRLGRRARRHRAKIAVAVLVTLAVALSARSGAARWQLVRNRLEPADTLRYSVLPFGYRDVDSSVAAESERLVRDALVRWTGITVVDEGQMRDVAGSGGVSSNSAAARVARKVRAGRYIRGDITGSGDRREVRLRLFDALNRDSLLAEATVSMNSATAQGDSALASVVDSLLLRELQRGETISRGTRSLPARQLYGQGQRALDEWKLARADSAFDAASRLDPGYAQAHLWLALVRSWSGVDAARWRTAVGQAVAGAGRLTERERVMAGAAQAHSRGESQHACPLWRQLTERDSLDAMAWYGSAYCQTADDVVLPDGESPSRWRFRTSYHQALWDYEHAFQLHPPMLASMGSNAFEKLGRLFKSGTTQLRQGRAAPPSTQKFSSSMEWTGDSLSFIPYPWGGTDALHVFRRPEAMNEAVRRQRALVRSVASSWVSAFPNSPEARQVLAMALASIGEQSGLDTLAVARLLARNSAPSVRLRVAGADVAMQLSFALRDGDTLRVRRARALADSLLEDPQSETFGGALLMSSLAALTGRASLAQRHARSSLVADAFVVPDALRNGAAELLVLSAIGGPADSLRALERRVADMIHRGISPDDRIGRRLEFLARAASMAFPMYRSEMLTQLAKDGDALVAIQVRLIAGDTAGVRRGLATFATVRRAMLPEHVALDALAPEAAVLWSLGDAGAVAEWLSPTLMVLPQAQPGVLSSPERSGSLPHALLLRARAAAKLGDRAGARRWATAVAILWSNADPFLQPLVKEARQLSR